MTKNQVNLMTQYPFTPAPYFNEWADGVGSEIVANDLDLSLSNRERECLRRNGWSKQLIFGGLWSVRKRVLR